MHLTIKAKLQATAEQRCLLFATAECFNAACDWISAWAFENQTFHKHAIQKEIYHDVREQFGLAAQATIRAIAKVADAYKAGNANKARTFHQHGAVIYDKRLLSTKDMTASLWTLQGRIKAPFVMGERGYELFHTCKRCGEVDLVYSRGEFYLCFVVEAPEQPELLPGGFLGVDMGIVNIATTSEGDTHTGEHVDKKRVDTQRRRRGLQRKGTKKAKYSLKKLSGKERRFKRNTNHVIAKQLVCRAKALGVGIAIEDLKGFRATVSRSQRERFGKWAFYELRELIEYKAKLAGVPVVAVNPRNTSRMCSCCGHADKKNRKTQDCFVCVKCGHQENADVNAAKNIAARACEQVSNEQTLSLRVVEGCPVRQPDVVQLKLF